MPQQRQPNCAKCGVKKTARNCTRRTAGGAFQSYCRACRRDINAAKTKTVQPKWKRATLLEQLRLARNAKAEEAAREAARLREAERVELRRVRNVLEARMRAEEPARRIAVRALYWATVQRTQAMHRPWSSPITCTNCRSELQRVHIERPLSHPSASPIAEAFQRKCPLRNSAAMLVS
jgi:hypothetical protein